MGEHFLSVPPTAAAAVEAEEPAAVVDAAALVDAAPAVAMPGLKRSSARSMRKGSGLSETTEPLCSGTAGLRNKAMPAVREVSAPCTSTQLVCRGTMRRPLRWFRRAVEQGGARGQNNLGYMYSNGQGVRRDEEEAVRWYRRAAEQGDALGQTNLATRKKPSDGTAALV